KVFGGEPHQSAVCVGDGGSAGGDEVVEPGFSVRRNRRSKIGNRVWSADRDEAEEGLVQLLWDAGVGAGFIDDALDGVRIESAEVARVLGERAAAGDGAGAALLERSIVEVGVGLRVEHLM